MKTDIIRVIYLSNKLYWLLIIVIIVLTLTLLSVLNSINLEKILISGEYFFNNS